MQRQREDKWCWAAVGSSVAYAYGTGGWTQCRVAEAEFAHQGWACCGADSSDPAKCNQPWLLDRALARVGHFDLMTATTAPFQQIRMEIDNRRPVGCRVAWANGGAHFVAITGWSVATDGTQYVLIDDPFHGTVRMPYAGFIGGYLSAGDSWTHTYFTSATPGPKGGAAPASPKNA
jgi:hypothetical protein